MNNNINTELVGFVSDKTGVEKDEVKACADLQSDLGIYGDDAMEFLLAFSKRFNVDVSMFKAADYFRGEGDTILPAIIRLITGERKPKRKRLTVLDLQRAIEIGKIEGPDKICKWMHRIEW